MFYLSLRHVCEYKYSNILGHPFVGAEASNGEPLNRIFAGFKSLCAIPTDYR